MRSERERKVGTGPGTTLWALEGLLLARGRSHWKVLQQGRDIVCLCFHRMALATMLKPTKEERTALGVSFRDQLKHLMESCGGFGQGSGGKSGVHPDPPNHPSMLRSCPRSLGLNPFLRVLSSCPLLLKNVTITPC